MKIWIQMTTLTILMLCDFSCRAYANGSSSSEDSTENSSEEPTGSNSGSDADEFINNVPDDFKINFLTEKKPGKSKVVFQPGERKCMKALKWLEETYTGNISMINTLVKYNIASCNAIPLGKSYCGRNTLGHTRSFKTKCHQCAKGCKDVLGGGTRYISCSLDDCKSAKEECEILSCLSNATCVFVENSYKCHCPDGFKGTNCNVDINECTSSPCQNRATCIDNVNGYRCKCAIGFQGTNCDEDINECASLPCQNGATCIDNINGYECNCVTGFQGTDCDVDINECANSPCQNGATCIDNVNGYACNCIYGFHGTNCDFETSVPIMRPQSIVHCVRPLRSSTVYRPSRSSTVSRRNICDTCDTLKQLNITYQSNTIPELPMFNRTNCT